MPKMHAASIKSVQGLRQEFRVIFMQFNEFWGEHEGKDGNGVSSLWIQRILFN
jgi:hypothetical protein